MQLGPPSKLEPRFKIYFEFSLFIMSKTWPLVPQSSSFPPIPWLRIYVSSQMGFQPWFWHKLWWDPLVKPKWLILFSTVSSLKEKPPVKEHHHLSGRQGEPPPVFASQDARMYSSLMMWTSLALGAFLELRHLADKKLGQRLPFLVLLWMCCAGGMYFHYYGVVFVGFLFLLSVTFLPFDGSRHARLRALLHFLPVGLLYLPWLPHVFSQPHGGTSWIGDNFHHAGYEFLRAGFNGYEEENWDEMQQAVLNFIAEVEPA